MMLVGHGTRERQVRGPLAPGAMALDTVIRARRYRCRGCGAIVTVVPRGVIADLIARLLAAVPPPKFHILRYHGVLAPHSKLRSAVTPQPPEFEDPMKAPASGDQRKLFKPEVDPNAARPARRPWAWLLRHVFLKDVSHCPRCGGPMRWVEVATTQDAIDRLMAELGEGPRPVSRRTPVPPEQLGFRFRR
jgi:hypothetical protein